MASSRSTNQTPLRRSRRNLRNRRNRHQPETPPNPPRVQFETKLKYENSLRNEDDVFFLSNRKRALPTAEELEVRKRKKFAVQVAKVSIVALRHKVVSLWEHGMCTNDLQFGTGASKKIIQWMQATYPAYERFEAAKSFFYRALKRHKTRAETSNLEPQRDKRGENKRKTKRENPAILELCDELLSEDKATAPKVQVGLIRNGFSVSLSTIYRIARDLTYRWTKPWHTDILTPD